MRKYILCAVIAAGAFIFAPTHAFSVYSTECLCLSGYTHSTSSSQSIDNCLCLPGSGKSTEITCITAVQTAGYYALSTFPTDTMLTGLFKTVYPTLKTVTLYPMGQMQDTETTVYTWYMYYGDSSGTLQVCWVDLTMTETTDGAYYWLYTLYIPTTTGTTSCSGVLENTYPQ